MHSRVCLSCAKTLSRVCNFEKIGDSLLTDSRQILKILIFLGALHGLLCPR
jgi:hypothetical protein